MLTASSRRIDKCPTPGQRFSDKFPTARKTRLQMPDKIKCPWGGVGWDGHTSIYRGLIIKLSLNNYLRCDSCKIAHYKLEDKLKFIFI